jgi:hypothetical protein
MPIIPFMGVRISRLMLARDCDLLQLASSAASLAAVLALIHWLKQRPSTGHAINHLCIRCFHHKSTVLVPAFEAVATDLTFALPKCLEFWRHARHM